MPYMDISTCQDRTYMMVFAHLAFICLPAELFITQYSEQWKKEKRLYVKALRGFGFGASSAEGKIQAEVDVLINQLLKFQEEAGEDGVSLSDPLSTAAANFIFSIILNEHYEPDDPALKDMKHMLKELFNISFTSVAVLEVLPVWLSKLLMPSLYKKLPGRLAELRHVIIRKIKKHQETHTPGEPRDFVDVILDEKVARDINHEEVADSCIVTLPDSLDNLPLAVEWLMLYVTKHPEVQAKIHSHIDEVIGKDRKPSLADKPNLPYLEAVMLETLRLATPVPVLLFHAVNENVQLRGYDIQKNALIMGNVSAVHFNPEVFPEPHLFRPERFINSEGQLVNADLIIPFGIGRFFDKT